MKHLVRTHYLLLLFLLCSLFMLSVLSGCKLRGSNIALPTATTASVAITMQNREFETSEPLGVLVKNTGSADVYALDALSGCTVLQLQHYDNDKKAWVAADRCHETVQPRVLTIRKGMSEPFTLAPNSPGDPNAWDSGTYRIALTYSTHPDGKSATETAYSPGFTISG
ncbi:MAG TPA: hypothetical protein VGF38_14490 [Ktedonobacterales bacterium]